MDRHRPCVPAGIRAAADLPAAEQVNVVHGYGHIPSGTARSLTGIGYNPSYPGAATAVDGQGGICADTGHLNLASIADAGRAAVDHAPVAQINGVGSDRDWPSIAKASPVDKGSDRAWR